LIPCFVAAPVKTPATAPVVSPRNIHGFDEGKEGTLNIVWDVSMENHYAVLVFSMASYFSMITQTFILV